MAASSRKSQVRIAYPPSANQSAFGTAQSNAALTKVFPIDIDGGDVQFEIVTTNDEVFDCSGQYLLKRVLQARSSRISFAMFADPAVAFRIASLGMGVVASSVASMLAATSFQPPPITLIWGHNGSAQAPLKLQDMVVDSFRITGRTVERVRMEVQFRGHGAPSTTSYTFPGCETPSPVYIKDGAFSLNSVDRVADLREFDFNYNNRLIFEEDPFPFASVDIARMEREDRREYPFNFKLWGEPGDATDLAAQANTIMPYSLRIGPVAGPSLTIATSASAILEQNGSPSHEGRANRSVLNLAAIATLDPAETSPVEVTYDDGV